MSGARGRRPATQERQLLDALAARAWPALEQHAEGGWLLRAARTATGAPATKRANSALGDGDLRVVEGWYAERGMAPRVQVSDPDLAARTAERGWVAEGAAEVWTGPLASADAGLVTGDARAWVRAWAVPEEADVVAGCLSRLAAPAGYVVLEEGGAAVAAGRGVVEDGWLGVFGMLVAPTHRRRGLARTVLGALGGWAAGLGADRAYLQVETGNDPARALYAGAGMVRAYDYHFRRKP